MYLIVGQTAMCSLNKERFVVCYAGVLPLPVTEPTVTVTYTPLDVLTLICTVCGEENFTTARL